MKTWHYKIPSRPPGEGWAYVMIREDGFFATVSDYGNYAYLWTSPGVKDIRRFFLRAEEEWDYFAAKLKPERSLDSEASFNHLRDDILQERRQGHLSKDAARERWKYLDEFEDDDWEGFVRDDRTHEYWPEPWQFGVMRRCPDVDAYAKKILPQLARLIKAELDAEALAAPAPPP
jgi:hypothetical protein